GVDLGIGADEAHVVRPGRPRPLARARQHRSGDVHARDMPAGGHAPGQLETRLARAAPDVEHAIAAAYPDAIHPRFAETADLLVQHLLERDPLRTCGVVPVGDLLRIRAGGIHGGECSSNGGTMTMATRRAANFSLDS